MASLRFMYYVCPIGIENLLFETETEDGKVGKGKPIVGAGVAQYAKIFDGVVQFKNSADEPDFEAFDVIFVDIWNANLSVVGKIREAIGYDSDTRIVAQIDWGDDWWWSQYPYPELFSGEMRKADYIGVPDEILLKTVPAIMDRRAFLLNMPMNIEELKEYRDVEKKPWAVVYGHKYFGGMYYLPWIALRGVPLSKIYTQWKEKEVWGLKALYDHIFKLLEAKRFMSLLGQSKVGIESYQKHCASRVVQEAGAIGLPSVGCMSVESIKRIFPELGTEQRDVLHQRKLILKLVNDDEFYEEMRQKGFERCEWYGLEASKKRFLEMLEHPPFEEQHE